MVGINKVKDYVILNLDKKLNLDILAGLINLSPSRFRQIFSDIEGEAPMQYVQRLRLEKAADFLQNDLQKSIADISHACGYSSQAFFCRAFQNYFHVSPIKYRQNYANMLKKSQKVQKKSQKVQKKSDFYAELCGFKNANKSIMSKNETKTLLDTFKSHPFKFLELPVFSSFHKTAPYTAVPKLKTPIWKK